LFEKFIAYFLKDLYFERDLMCNYKKVLFEKQASFWTGFFMILDGNQALSVRLSPLFSSAKPYFIRLVLICLVLSGCAGRESVAVFSTPEGPKRVLLEVAATEAKRNRGLMFRTHLGEGRGMLFVFEEPGRPAFWMKNTYLSLDILFLSTDGIVVDLFERLSPCPMEPCPRYAPDAPARYVLEVAGGFVAHHAVRKGDRIRLENVPGVLPRQGTGGIPGHET
jgi:uncharacterized membrane protein (UPF0127 family)